MADANDEEREFHEWWHSRRSAFQTERDRACARTAWLERARRDRERGRGMVEALKRIEAEDYEPIGESFTAAAAAIARAALAGQPAGGAGEVEELRRLNEDKFRTIQAYCRAASQDKAEIERLRKMVEEANGIINGVWYGSAMSGLDHKRWTERYEALAPRGGEGGEKPSMQETLDRIREAGGKAWDKIEDPEGYIRWMRGDDDEAARAAAAQAEAVRGATDAAGGGEEGT